jgi:DNA invertase Pin-like site-specific DNA recombinase
MRAQIARGEWHGTPLPYGYDNVEKKLVVNEVEAELIRRIFRDYLSGVSSKDIAVQLNQ